MNIDVPETENGGQLITHGRSQGYVGLPVRHQMTRTELTDGRIMEGPCMVTRWSPTEDERVRLLAGEDVFVRILGSTPPPMRVGVGDPDRYGW